MNRPMFMSKEPKTTPSIGLSRFGCKEAAVLAGRK